MRRADKEVKDLEQLEEILRACTAVRIGTRDERGMFIVPMSYGYTPVSYTHLTLPTIA